MKEILHHQLPLTETVKRISTTVTGLLRKLERLESEEGRTVPRTLDSRAFSIARDTITRYAIDLVSPEWEVTK
jgi:hypothetical protein